MHEYSVAAWSRQIASRKRARSGSVGAGPPRLACRFRSRTAGAEPTSVSPIRLRAFFVGAMRPSSSSAPSSSPTFFCCSSPPPPPPPPPFGGSFLPPLSLFFLFPSPFFLFFVPPSSPPPPSPPPLFFCPPPPPPPPLSSVEAFLLLTLSLFVRLPLPMLCILGPPACGGRVRCSSLHLGCCTGGSASATALSHVETASPRKVASVFSVDRLLTSRFSSVFACFCMMLVLHRQ